MMTNTWVLSESGIHVVETASLLQVLAKLYNCSEDAVSHWLAINRPVVQIQNLSVTVPTGGVIAREDKTTQTVLEPFTRPLRAAYIIRQDIMKEVFTQQTDLST